MGHIVHDEWLISYHAEHVQALETVDYDKLNLQGRIYKKVQQIQNLLQVFCSQMK